MRRWLGTVLIVAGSARSCGRSSSGSGTTRSRRSIPAGSNIGWRAPTSASSRSTARAPVTPRPTRSTAVEARLVAAEAKRLRTRAGEGAPIGHIRVPRLHLNMLVVNGTDHDSLKRGPGRDERTYMPGEGKLVYIAGHRTTYAEPFAEIDRMRPGDEITLVMPYATFTYVVTGHRIVDATDLSVLGSRGRETLALQACHPRFFATHRYIVWAKPVKVSPREAAPIGTAARPRSERRATRLSPRHEARSFRRPPRGSGVGDRADRRSRARPADAGGARSAAAAITFRRARSMFDPPPFSRSAFKSSDESSGNVNARPA